MKQTVWVCQVFVQFKYIEWLSLNMQYVNTFYKLLFFIHPHLMFQFRTIYRPSLLIIPGCMLCVAPAAAATRDTKCFMGTVYKSLNKTEYFALVIREGAVVSGKVRQIKYFVSSYILFYFIKISKYLFHSVNRHSSWRCSPSLLYSSSSSAAPSQILPQIWQPLKMRQ